eukprot:jgi/Ulvmu1/11195/UM072_0031.1
MFALSQASNARRYRSAICIHVVHMHLQVWYSAAWTDATAADFSAAVAEVMQGDSHEAEVRVWLQAWRDTIVPLRDARREWLDRQVGDNPETLQLNLETDWRAMTRYRLTGEILGGDVGSSVFFVRPEEPSRRPEFTAPEDLWFAMAPEALAAQRLKGGSFVAAATTIARRRVAALRAALGSGTVTVQVRPTIRTMLLSAILLSFWQQAYPVARAAPPQLWRCAVLRAACCAVRASCPALCVGECSMSRASMGVEWAIVEWASVEWAIVEWAVVETPCVSPCTFQVSEIVPRSPPRRPCTQPPP